MTIYDRTHELANELKNTAEVLEYRNSYKKIQENEKNKELVDKLRKIQFEAYNEQIEKGDISQETKEKMQNLGAILSANIDVSNYIHAESKFAVLWEDIIKILHDSVGLDLTLKNDNQ